MVSKEYILDAIQTKSKLLTGIDLNRNDAENIFAFNTSMPNILLGEDGKGFVWGSVMPHHLNYNIKIGTIIVSWFESKYKGLYSMSLVKQFIKEAEVLGANIILLDDCLCAEEISRIYKKLGFKKLETHYYKGVK